MYVYNIICKLSRRVTDPGKAITIGTSYKRFRVDHRWSKGPTAGIYDERVILD